jgi:hydroxymethylglutaryl-CoA lyase
MLPSHVRLVEVGPRDGLQNEASPVSTAQKIELVSLLQDAGLREVEVTSFVSPKWVPQMADGAQVMAGVPRREGVRHSVLVPNLRGFEAALPTRPDEVVVFTAASEAFNQRNLNCSIDESLERIAPVVQAARAQGLRVRGSISCAVGCPYQGEVSADAVERVAQRLRELGVQHCGVADTIGVGTPLKVQRAMERALRHYPLDEVSGHFHDTYGQALANVQACLQLGIATFDASVAGLGGCPYAPGATGNVATEGLLFLLDGLGIETGVDMARLIDAVDWISGVIGRPPASRVGRAMLAKRRHAALAAEKARAA